MCGFQQVVADIGFLGEFGTGLLFAASFAGADEDGGFESGVPSGLEVHLFVADEVGAGEVQTEFVFGLEDEGGLGFASDRGLVGSFGGNVVFKDLNAPGLKEFGESGIDGVNVFDGKVAAAYSGLVGDDDEGIAGLLELLERFTGMWTEDNFLRFMQVVQIFVDGAIAVQENGRSHVFYSCGRVSSISSGLAVAVPTLATTTPAA